MFVFLFADERVIAVLLCTIGLSNECHRFSNERYQMSCMARNSECVRANQTVVVVMSVVCEPMIRTAILHTDEVVSMASAVACRLWSNGTKLNGVDNVVSNSKGSKALMISVEPLHSSPKRTGVTVGMMMYNTTTIGVATSDVRSVKLTK